VIETLATWLWYGGLLVLACYAIDLVVLVIYLAWIARRERKEARRILAQRRKGAEYARE
jgi:hypothetical protein